MPETITEAEPYSPTELDAVREIITQFNPPDSAQRRLLATVDLLTTQVDAAKRKGNVWGNSR